MDDKEIERRLDAIFKPEALNLTQSELDFLTTPMKYLY